VVFITALYIVAGVWLAIYGLNSLLLAGLYLRHRQQPTQPTPPPTNPPPPVPPVTVQFPI
jgi:hypothetical protein